MSTTPGGGCRERLRVGELAAEVEAAQGTRRPRPAGRRETGARGGTGRNPRRRGTGAPRPRRRSGRKKADTPAAERSPSPPADGGHRAGEAVGVEDVEHLAAAHP